MRRAILTAALALAACGPSMYVGTFNGPLSQQVTCDNGGTAAETLLVSWRVTENPHNWGVNIVNWRNQCSFFVDEGPNGATLSNPDAEHACGADTLLKTATLTATAETLEVRMVLETVRPTKCTSILSGTLRRE